ncbi:MAG: small multi-drug export protein [Methanobacterium sp.]|uniref:small multi-drug export protein n=1 Tax=Methanobacterium sp. TaxID=2164 RepID=UPI003D65C60B|nr:small multi-drug export protein [Methanobacterium sp.]
MDIILGILLVFGASVFELWAAIPIGLAIKLNPVLIGIFSALGAIFAAFLVSTVGDNIRERFMKWRYGKNKDIKNSSFYKIWNKYGIIGLGILSPLLFGAPLGAALGIALGARIKPLLIWMTIGIVIWSVLLTTAGYFGLMTFESRGYFAN